MAAPLRSVDSAPVKDIQFTHFGVLDTGRQSTTSTVTSLILNCVAACVVIVISAAATRTTIEHNKKLTELIIPITEKKPDIPKPKVIPPKPIVAKVEPPKIKVPDIKVPEPPKPVVKMDTPKPIVLPAPPKQVVAMAAPQVVNLGHPQAASIPNNDAHPSPVRLGTTDSPINNLHGPAVSPVVLGRGVPGMSASNTGSGPPASKVNLGSGQPDGQAVRGGGAVAVVGIPHGVPGGTGPLNSTGRVAGPVNLGQNEPTATPRSTQAAVETAKVKAPKVIYKPRPEYTPEARQLHLEGLVSVRIRVLSDGSVEVLGITNGLGHGLDESARRAVLATKFEPATDASGHPVTWDGVVNVAFQLAG
jgi:periplasmic protein TonB